MEKAILQTDLQINKVTVSFLAGKLSIWDRIVRKKPRFLKAVDDVSLRISRAETLVLLGESGSGKTTLGRVIVGLTKPSRGEVFLGSEKVENVGKGTLRGKLQMVFQDPSSSLDPFMKVFDCISEPLSKSGLSRSEIRTRVLESMEIVSLEKSIVDRKTSELSGGQKQRVSIARCLVSDPNVIILDEPTSSIDVSIQAQVLNLLVKLQQLKKFTFVLITHDPNVAKFMADTVAVMYLGKIVEYGRAEKVLSDPMHPYTVALLESTPRIDRMSLPAVIKGEPPSLIRVPSGCRYHPRCPKVMPKCSISEPILWGRSDSVVACYLYHDLGRETRAKEEGQSLTAYEKDEKTMDVT